MSLTLLELAKEMRGIDLTMLTTHTDDHNIAGRPMSNNGEVDYDGSSYYFTWDKLVMITDIEKNDKLALSLRPRRPLRLGRRDGVARERQGACE